MASTESAAQLERRRKPAPRVWLVLGDKAGDNAQVDIIAAALGWPCERKPLVFQARYVLGKPPFKASLYHIDAARSAPLQPPWPDLVITVGRRPAMAALWIQEQSGGRTRLVLLGRPKRWLERFSLVIAPSQYLLPAAPNVLSLELPLVRVNEAGIAAAVATWRPRLAALPRPLTALLVGGRTKPFLFDAAVTKELLRQADRGAAGGALYITTSRRTQPEILAALQSNLPPGARLYRWRPDDPDNPYLALLGLADRFIVTGDSISMMVEVARLGRPLAIFPLPYRLGLLERLRAGLMRLTHSDAADGRRAPLQPLGDLLYRLGLVSYSRDLTALHAALIERGLATRLGEPFPPPGRRAPDELDRVAARIAALWEDT